VTPTPRVAVVLAALALSALVAPWPAVALAVLGLGVATATDLRFVRRPPDVNRLLPTVVARGTPAAVQVSVEAPSAGAIRIRQPVPPDLALAPGEAEGRLESTLVGRRRGRHRVEPAAVRSVGPLGLGAWHHDVGEPAEVLVYPDLPGARRIASSVRRGRFREEGRRRGPIGIGTEFESVRDYLPDDDVRVVNWRATARLGRPMSNQYRVERDRDVICLVDCGRLMGAPLGDATRLDVALDAAVAVAAVADELGDRAGAIAFDDEVRRSLRPRRRGAADIVRALFDLEPTRVDSDYELAFASVGEAKRAFVLVLTDLLEESAARPLLDALPVLARRHSVAVATAADTDLDEAIRREPARPLDVYRAAVALDVLGARTRVARLLRAGGAEVVEATPRALPATCVRSYLRAKARLAL
jgi:uncharacterized protein (DUF58 family)